jgi:putative ABC transport system permease protein
MPEAEGRPLELRFAAGRSFSFDHRALLAEAAFQAHLREEGDHAGHDHGDAHAIPEAWEEIVIGALVARELGLGLGSTIVPAHGVGATLHHHDEAECRVVGILEPLGTPIDRAIYMPLGAFYRMQEHAAIGSDSKRADDVEISAIVLNTRPPMGHLQVARAFQRRSDAIASLPADEIRRLFTVVGNIALALRAISFLVLIVGAIGVFIALYTTMNERRRDVAIMRSLGARRLQIFGIVLLEALLITAVGAVLGVLGAHLIAFGLADWLLARTGVPMTGATFALAEVWLILGVSILGAGAGLLPAVQASRTDVAQFLGPDR